MSVIDALSLLGSAAVVDVVDRMLLGMAENVEVVQVGDYMPCFLGAVDDLPELVKQVPKIDLVNLPNEVLETALEVVVRDMLLLPDEDEHIAAVLGANILQAKRNDIPVYEMVYSQTELMDVNTVAIWVSFATVNLE